MRVGIFTDTYLPDINGVATSSHILRNELVKQGHEVLVVTTEIPDDSDYLDKDEMVLRLPGIEYKKLYGYRISNIYSFKGMKEIKLANLDVIHIQTEFGIGIFGKIVAEFLNLPVVYTYHTLYEDYSHYISQSDTIQPIIKKVITKFSQIYGDNCTELIVPSDKTRQILESYKIEKDMHVIATGLELEHFNVLNANQSLIDDIKEQYQLNDDDFHIVFLGRVAKEKSIDILIRAMSSVKAKDLKVKLIIVGGGPSLDDLKDLAISLDLMDYITFTGPKTAELVPSFYHLSDVFASASTSETQGLTFIEAMASSIPVLARPDKNLEEIIIDDYNGYYFNDEFELADIIEKMMKMDLNMLKENAFKSAQPYGSEHFCEAVLKVYQQAIRNKHYIYRISAVFPLSNNYYEIVFKSDSNEVTLELPEKIILQYELEKNKTIEREELDELKDHERIYQAYKKALRFLTVRDYTYKQMYDKLAKNDQFDEFHIDMTLQALIEKNLINDEMYTTNYLERATRMGMGINKAIRKLKEKGITSDVIDVCLLNHSKEKELENAINRVSKLYSSNTNKSKVALIKASREHLFAQGFQSDIVEEALNNFDFQVDESFEKELLNKEAQKALKKYERKFSGNDLIQKVFIYLSRKGFKYEHINEWKDNFIQEGEYNE